MLFAAMVGDDTLSSSENIRNLDEVQICPLRQSSASYNQSFPRGLTSASPPTMLLLQVHDALLVSSTDWRPYSVLFTWYPS